MPAPIISVDQLQKTYRVPVRPPGLGASLKSLARRQYETVEAVRGITFTIQPGEVVGLIGPNGAGKTTTLKLLCGLLYPTSGTARVAGFVPWERKSAYLRRISMVLGNKSQMIWDIPPLDSFRVLAEIYRLPAARFRQTLDELVDLLEMQALLTKPVRNLSLGERMKCELVASLLHQPAVMFLDEPTLGLDISMQLRLRRFLAAYNQRCGVTLILTSHYMADVTALCPRVILIHQGRMLYDGALAQLAQQLAPFKLIRLSLAGDDADLDGAVRCEPMSLPAGVDVVDRAENGSAQGGQITLRVPRAAAPAVTAQLLTRLPVADLSVEDPPIEAVIDQVYREGGV